MYEFRIAVISEHFNSMSIKTEADEIEYHFLKGQIAALQESINELKAREKMLVRMPILLY